MRTLILFFLFLAIIFTSCQKDYKNDNQRLTVPLEKEWYFSNSDIEGGEQPGLNDNNWETVQVPHDWAIKGPFDENNDAQNIQFVNKGVKQTYTHKGRTGGLPHVGVGWYRKHIEIPDSLTGRNVFIEFDGAMSHARVFLNGEFIGEWPYGYAS
jgi:beta-galactosidase